MINFYVTWLASVLFWVGVLLVPVGLALIVVPGRILGSQARINRWISSREFFDRLNAPRYQERLFYRHHRWTGGVVMLLSGLCLFRLGLDLRLTALESILQRIARTPFEAWLFPQLYWILMLLLALAFTAGVIIFIRPSVLKRFEAWANRWVETDGRLERLDTVKDIPAHILPGKPRLFGLAVLAGALYIVYQTAPMAFS